MSSHVGMGTLKQSKYFCFVGKGRGVKMNLIYPPSFWVIFEEIQKNIAGNAVYTFSVSIVCIYKKRLFCTTLKKFFYLFYTTHIITILILYIANLNIFHYKLDFFFILYLYIHVSLFLVPEVILWNIFYKKNYIQLLYLHKHS